MTLPQQEKNNIKSIFSLLTTNISDIFKPLQQAQGEPIVIDPTELAVWYIGHATILINFYGTVIVTDPVLVNWIPFPRRIVSASHSVDDLPPLDYIFLSHAHFDHWNTRTLRALASKTKTVIIPKNCEDLLASLNFTNIEIFDWDEKREVDNLAIHAIRPLHWGQRVPWERMNRQYNAYMIEHKGKTIFFGGDSAYGPYYKELGQQYNIDIALLGAGAYRPDSFRAHHQDPEEALQAFEDLGATHMIPFHWGSFRLSFESLEEPPFLLSQIAETKNLIDRVHILRNGETRSL